MAFGAAAFGVVAVGVIAIEVAAMTAVWVAGGRVGIAVAIGVVTIFVSVLITSCQVSLNPNSGPLTNQTRMNAASTKANGYRVGMRRPLCEAQEWRARSGYMTFLQHVILVCRGTRPPQTRRHGPAASSYRHARCSAGCG